LIIVEDGRPQGSA